MAQDKDRRLGQQRLRALLPWARAEARKTGGEYHAGSELGRATLTYITENNLDALMIYPAPLGGWHADIIFKSVPPGVPDSMGTPVERPCRTRDEAEQAAKILLVAMCKAAARNAETPPAHSAPVFLLYGGVFTLSADLYQLALAAMPEGSGGENGGYVSKARAIERIEETLATYFPGDFSVSAFNAADREAKAALMTVLHIAALTGLYAYPPRVDKTPSGHADPGQARH